MDKKVAQCYLELVQLEQVEDRLEYTVQDLMEMYDWPQSAALELYNLIREDGPQFPGQEPPEVRCCEAIYDMPRQEVMTLVEQQAQKMYDWFIGTEQDTHFEGWSPNEQVTIYKVIWDLAASLKAGL